ncbi:MAG: 3-dehydroquinate synthase [Eubacterium sp.]|nr:3-dehydroquinate synthase [Eubacterium sp.]
MTTPLHVKYDGQVIYDIVFKKDFTGLGSCIKDAGLSPKRIMIVMDSNVAGIYCDEVKGALSPLFDEVHTWVFPAGESHKNLSTVEGLYEELIVKHFDRKDLLVALGGGVTGDLTGFTAATYLRGISFVQVPTSLLSMTDSSVGGKTGVDFRAYKNMVGAFYMPRLVYMNTSVLRSLPKREFAGGMGEVIKHGIIFDNDFLTFLHDNADAIKALDDDVITQTVKKSCDFKRIIVEEDPTEQGIRATLNFGHTIGHAIEKLLDFKLLHGECVAIGSNAALYICAQKGLISDEDYARALELFREFDLPVCVYESPGVSSADIERITPELVLETMLSDKKTLAGRIRFILLRKMGEAYIDSSLTDEELTGAIKAVLYEN